MRRLYLITLAALCSGLAFGQNTGGGGAKTSTIKSGTSLPATCTPAANNIFLLTSPLPAALYWCSGPNTWTTPGGGGGSGTVTSVGLTAPSWLTVGGSPVTTSGTLALTTTGSQTANQFLATPNGTTGAVGLRSIVAADIPTLNQSTTGNAATATALAANPVDCSAGQYANAIDVNGNLTCTAVSYSQVSGTPSLFYQTIQNSGTPVTQRAKLNFVGGTNVTITPTDNGTDTTTLTFAASGGGGSPGGTNTAVQFNNSGAFGGDATNFSYNSTTHALTVTGGITSSSTSSGTITLNGSTSGSAAIQVAATAGTPAPLQLPTATGGAGNILTTNGANPQVLSWTTIPRSINATFDGGGSALTTGKVLYQVVPFACTIAAWNLTVDTGTATVKLWKVANGTAIPTSANSINTSGISISSGTNIHSTTLTDFTTTSVAANDIVAVTDTAVSGATFLQVGIQCNE